MRAGILIDDYKLSAFEKALTASGFEFTQHNGPKEGIITLVVEFTEDTKSALVKLVTTTNAQHSRGVN